MTQCGEEGEAGKGGRRLATGGLLLELDALVLVILVSLLFCVFEIFHNKMFFKYVGEKVEISLFCSHPLSSWIHFIMFLCLAQDRS